MTSPRATGMFHATVLQPAAAVPDRDGKVTPGGGKDLPAGLPVDANRDLAPVPFMAANGAFDIRLFDELV